MAFNIKNDRADELLRELTELTGESLTTAITESLRQRLERERRLAASHDDADAAADIDPLAASIQHFRNIVTAPPADDAVAYDEHGLPA